MKKEILYQNKKISYQCLGEGKPVMLVHGFGEDGNVWNNQAPSNYPEGGEIVFAQNQLTASSLLNKGYRFIIPDLPGSGQSEMISDMSIEGMAEVLHAIVHKENTNSCVMIGHSMGGYITLAFAEKYWNHLDAFGLVHSTAFADSEEKKSARRKGIDFIKHHGAFNFLKATIPNLFLPGSDLVNDFISKQSGFSPEALIAYYHAMIMRPDRTHVLKNAAVPILLIAGEQDIAIPIQDVLKQSHLADKCFFTILKKSAHMGMLEEPEIVNRLIEEFLTVYPIISSK